MSVVIRPKHQAEPVEEKAPSGPDAEILGREGRGPEEAGEGRQWPTGVVNIAWVLGATRAFPGWNCHRSKQTSPSLCLRAVGILKSGFNSFVF